MVVRVDLVDVLMVLFQGDGPHVSKSQAGHEAAISQVFPACWGVSLALPMLESAPHSALGQDISTIQAYKPKRRMVAVNVELGLHAPNITPEQAGRNYELSPYLKLLERFRNDFTYISGASHPEVDGGHASRKSFLTGMRHPLAPDSKFNFD